MTAARKKAPEPAPAKAAGGHAAWFREQVEQALREADQQPASLISQQQHEKDWAAKRAALLAKARVR